jgi:hypothetical protein
VSSTERRMLQILLTMVILFAVIFLLIALVPAEWLDKFYPME